MLFMYQQVLNIHMCMNVHAALDCNVHTCMYMCTYVCICICTYMYMYHALQYLTGEENQQWKISAKAVNKALILEAISSLE